MLPAIVIGHGTSSAKYESLRGCKLLLVQPMSRLTNTPDGDPLLAVDRVGAGKGERVIITSDGRSAREALKSDQTPVRWTIIGSLDGEG